MATHKSAYTAAQIEQARKEIISKELEGLLYFKGNGLGNTGTVLKIQSNNATLNGYGDGSSNFHFAGVGVHFDKPAAFLQGFTFPTYGGDLTGNATNLKNFSIAEFRAKSANKVETGCDFNAYPAEDQQNFVVKNNNPTGGYGRNWAYQSYAYNPETSQFERNFGVKADGTVISKGEELATVKSVEERKSVTVAATLSAKSWSNGSYTWSNANIKRATQDIEIRPAETITVAQLEAIQGANIVGTAQAVGSVTFKAFGDVPTIDIPVKFIIKNDDI